ncbi:hypothetical protein M9Y10_021270 [Tritrichomonas musculus]|uniref:ubiquitinyl hydrolase 1 n=1 Tax=Tritrichomonas musculus TaxID=1915356 RepID=A0ABR2HED8_9EUKA
MDESSIILNKDQSNKYITNWCVQFSKESYTSPTYDCNEFTFRITSRNPLLVQGYYFNLECTFCGFKYYEYDIQYTLLIFDIQNPTNNLYSSGIQTLYNRDSTVKFDLKRNDDPKKFKSLLDHILESLDQKNERSADNEPIFCFHIEFNITDKPKEIYKWFIPKDDISEYHITPDPIIYSNFSANCVFTPNEQGYYTFQLFYFDVKKTMIQECVITLHNHNLNKDGSIKVSTMISTSNECGESKMLLTYITYKEILDEGNGWIFDGGLHITINFQGKNYRTSHYHFISQINKKTSKPIEDSKQTKPSPSIQKKEKRLIERCSNCETVYYSNIKLHSSENDQFCQKNILISKKENILIPSGGKYTICLNLNKSMFITDYQDKKSIYTSPILKTELNNNEFQIIINLTDQELTVKSKNSLKFKFDVKYSNSILSSPQGESIQLPFNIDSAFSLIGSEKKMPEWLYSKENDNPFVYDGFNVILPHDSQLHYIKMHVEISYIENMVNGIDLPTITTESSITILTFYLPTDSVIMDERGSTELPTVCFPKVSYKSPTDDYCYEIKPELVAHTDEPGYKELCYVELFINKQVGKYPIFCASYFARNNRKRTDDEFVTQSRYYYVESNFRRVSFPSQFKPCTFNELEFIEPNNESYFKMKLVIVAGDYIEKVMPIKKVTPIDISKIQQRPNYEDDHFQRNTIKLIKRKSLIKEKMYKAKLTEEEMNQKIESINSQRKKRNGFAGLKNQGATCYMNSILQSLFHLPSFRRIVYEMPTTGNEDAKTSIPLNLQRLFYDLQFSDNPISTEDLTKSFGWGPVETFNQHDSQEFLRVLLENLIEKMKKANLPDGIPNLFRGKLRRYIRCINVDYESRIEEEFYDICMPIKNMKNLEESFENYVKQQELTGKDQYSTESHGKQDAVTGEEFLCFPPILFLHLARFEFNLKTGEQEKINDRFEFPSTIDLSKYLAVDAPGRSMSNIYDLYGVVVHSGTSRGGHYYAFLKTKPETTNNFNWFQFNDTYVKEDTIENAIKDNFGGYNEQLRPDFNVDSDSDSEPEVEEISNHHPHPYYDRNFDRFRYHAMHRKGDIFDDYYREIERHERPRNKYHGHHHSRSSRGQNKPSPISHSAYILIYIRRADADKVFQPIKDEDVPQHLKEYMMNKEQEKRMIEVQSIRNEFESQLKSITLYIMTENILSYFSKKKITGWNEQANFERDCRSTSNSSLMKKIECDIFMKCDELYTNISKLFSIDRAKVRIWRLNIVDNFPLKIIPDSDKSNIGAMRREQKEGKMSIMVQMRTEENSLPNNLLDINNNLMLYIKFFSSKAKKDHMRYAFSYLLNLDEENDRGNDRLSDRLIPVLDKMFAYPAGTKYEAFIERTSDAVKLDLARSITSIKNDATFRNGTVLIVQLSKESSSLPIPPIFASSQQKEEEFEEEEEDEKIENDDGKTENKDEKVPVINWKSSNDAFENQLSSFYLNNEGNSLAIEIRNIEDFDCPLARIVSKEKMSFIDLHNIIYDKFLKKNEKNHKKQEDENENVSIDSFYKKEDINEEDIGKPVLPGDDGPILFLKVKDFASTGETDKDLFKIASINTTKNEYVNDVFNSKIVSGKRKHKVGKTEDNFFIVYFYAFKAYNVTEKKDMVKYKTGYSELAYELDFKFNFKAPSRLCFIDIINLTWYIKKAVDNYSGIIFNSGSPYGQNSPLNRKELGNGPFRVFYTSAPIVIETFNNIYSYSIERNQFMDLRVEKIPEDQVGVPENELMDVSFAYNEVISISNNKPLMVTKYFGSPFIFKIIKDELFSETKKRIINSFGYGNLMEQTLSEFTFHFKVDHEFEIPDKFPKINDNDCLFSLRDKRHNHIAVMPRHPPESHPLILSDSNKNSNNKRDDKSVQKYKPKDKSNSIKIYN